MNLIEIQFQVSILLYNIYEDDVKWDRDKSEMTKAFSFFHCVAVWRMSGGRCNWSEDDSGKAIAVVQQVIKGPDYDITLGMKRWQI